MTDTRTEKQFIVPIEKILLAVIGRSNDSGYTPTLDLMKIDGAKRGVSRYHATINLHKDALMITDHNSTNGTFIDGNRIVAGETQPIQNGDTIQLGTIRLKVSFT